jgi:hypothetical protein
MVKINEAAPTKWACFLQYTGTDTFESMKEKSFFIGSSQGLFITEVQESGKKVYFIALHVER